MRASRKGQGLDEGSGCGRAKFKAKWSNMKRKNVVSLLSINGKIYDKIGNGRIEKDKNGDWEMRKIVH